MNSREAVANTEKIRENKLTIKNNSITTVSLKCNTVVTLPVVALVRPSTVSKLKWVSRSAYLIKDTNFEFRNIWHAVGTLSFSVKRTSTYLLMATERNNADEIKKYREKPFQVEPEV